VFKVKAIKVGVYFEVTDASAIDLRPVKVLFYCTIKDDITDATVLKYFSVPTKGKLDADEIRHAVSTYVYRNLSPGFGSEVFNKKFCVLAYERQKHQHKGYYP
ncbi:MAG: hypothetical protein ACJAWN_000786, partial [Neolewinella sp.]